jgi:hypothetical protein
MAVTDKSESYCERSNYLMMFGKRTAHFAARPKRSGASHFLIDALAIAIGVPKGACLSYRPIK